jgi:recombination protein RecR
MNSIEKLTEIFSHFPGIGPRQAKRFVYYLLSRNNGAIEEIVRNLTSLENEIKSCNDCKMFFQAKNNSSVLCSICSNPQRESEYLMIVSRDTDVESIEKSSTFKGKYFVLGGTIPILEKTPERRVRLDDLKKIINNKASELKEIILAMNWNPEGENTAEYIEQFIKTLSGKDMIKISHLGKGLSMGTEIEYADPDTIKNALSNRY